MHFECPYGNEELAGKCENAAGLAYRGRISSQVSKSVPKSSQSLVWAYFEMFQEWFCRKGRASFISYKKRGTSVFDQRHTKYEVY